MFAASFLLFALQYAAKFKGYICVCPLRGGIGPLLKNFIRRFDYQKIAFECKFMCLRKKCKRPAGLCSRPECETRCSEANKFQSVSGQTATDGPLAALQPNTKFVTGNNQNLCGIGRWLSVNGPC